MSEQKLPPSFRVRILKLGTHAPERLHNKDCHLRRLEARLSDHLNLSAAPAFCVWEKVQNVSSPAKCYSELPYTLEKERLKSTCIHQVPNQFCQSLLSP